MRPSLTIHVQSLADLQNGKMLFPNQQKELDECGFVSGSIEAIGIMEEGTQEKRTSVTLLIATKYIDPDQREKGEQTMWITAHTTAALFLHTSMAVSMAVRKFEKPNTENKS